MIFQATNSSPKFLTEQQVTNVTSEVSVPG